MTVGDEIWLTECPRCGDLRERTDFRLLPSGWRSTFCTTCTTAAREDWFRQHATDVAARLKAWRSRRLQ